MMTGGFVCFILKKDEVCSIIPVKYGIILKLNKNSCPIEKRTDKDGKEWTKLESVYQKLCALIGGENVLSNEIMKNHTSFHVGGAADYFVTPDREEKIRELLLFSLKEDIPLAVIGNGSNLLVRDKGIRGIVLCIGEKFSSFEIEGDLVRAQAGILLSNLSAHILSSSLTGFEFASGIPGTLGGGVAMNAGAYGGELKDIIESVKVMDRSGRIFTLNTEQMQFGYRKSRAGRENLLVLSAEIRLVKGNQDEIRAKMEDFATRRKTKQPLSACSAGSTFKRPEGYFAGKLIEDAGLKGLEMGEAAVSDLHSGFVINKGSASCQEILDLISFIKSQVLERFGVHLEEEVKIIGEK